MTSSDPNWKQALKKARKAQERDHEATHMIPPSDSKLDYLELGELKDLILEPSNWDRFAYAMPPKGKADVTLSEVKQIRNRVAHFREPNADDSLRLQSAAADLDAGLKAFASRYSQCTHFDVNVDPVVKELEARWDALGWRVEMLIGNKWLYASAESRQNPSIHGHLGFLSRPQSTSNPITDGGIYKLGLSLDRNSRSFDLDQFVLRLQDTRENFIHLCSDEAGTELTLTVPAQLGPDIVADTIASAIEAAKISMGSATIPNIQSLKDRWKSTLYWPDHLANAVLSGYEYYGGSLIR
jgi:hypothetical protein